MREKGYFEFVNVFKCNNLPTGSACGIALYYMRAPVFPRVCDYRINLVVRAISLILMPLEFLRCDVPVSSKLAWWQQLVTHVSESLKTVSLIQATTSLPILWSIEWTLTITSWILIRALKRWSITKNESITTFEAWRQNLQYFLSFDANFAPFLADNCTWLKKSSTAPNIGLKPDGDDVPTTRRLTAFQKNLHLDLMLGQIPNFCPVISRSSIVNNSTSISSVW